MVQSDSLMNGSDTYTDWTLISLSPWPATVLWLCAGAVVASLIVLLWQYRHIRQRGGLIALRILTAIALIALLTEPAIQLRAVRKITNRVVLVVDRSESMDLPAGVGSTRMTHVQQFLRASQTPLKNLAMSHAMHWRDLDGPITPAQIDTPPRGSQSDLLQALESAKETADGKPLAGLVLLSDGADSGVLDAHAEKNKLSSQAIARLKALGVPVNTIDVVGETAYRDIRIAEVLADEFAFVHNTMSIDVVVQATGFHNVRVPVTLKDEGAIVSTQDVLVSEGYPHRITFNLKPDTIGDKIYSVHIPVFADEAVTTNNQRILMVRVIRDKIRVLQVAGHPSWDERFLRQHLKDNPNVDLISFFILRTPEDEPGPEKELSLIPFPVDELFTTQLSTFDVLILQDFDYRPYHMAQYLPNIRDAVHAGLGFVMMGGPHSFGAGGYAESPIEAILPVMLRDAPMHNSPFQPMPTMVGAHHPITDLAPGSNGPGNAQLWARLPQWQGINPTAGLVPGATALVQAPTAGAEGTPVIAVMDVGSGRSMAITTPSVWRWRFAKDRQGGMAERAYQRFWSNALRWLVRDPEHARIRVQPAQRVFQHDDTVNVTFSALGDDYQPTPDVPLQITLERVGEDTSVAHTHVLRTGTNGVITHTYDAIEPGAYRVTAARQANASATRIQGSATFLREFQSTEREHGTPRTDLLRAIAQHTGGHYSTLTPDAWDTLRLHDPDVVDIDRRRNIELWDNGAAMLIVAALLVADWILRRRRGYA